MLSLLDAFSRIDRICRGSRVPSRESLLLRACCLVGLGHIEAGRRDARAAYDVDGADREAQHLVLKLDAMPDRVAEVAAALLAAPDATDDQAMDAARALLDTTDLVVRCRRDALGVTCVVAWRGAVPPSVRCDGFEVAIDAPRRLRSSPGGFGRCRVPGPPGTSRTIQVRLAGRPVHETSLPALWAYDPGATVRSATVRSATRISVVVPVFGGLAATQACLEALACQTRRPDAEVIVVDDASPDRALSAWVAERCRREGWRYLRQAENAGFASAVNRGASQARGQDLLLLNADAVLPPTAIDRLLDAARGPGIGTVVPFSNDGGFTSFPRMRRGNAVPSAEEAARLDAAARDALNGRCVDIPSGTAFCMLVTRACWDELGGLALDYGRGYFEDVDLCLRAKRRGYRNVLAPGLYVRHVGAQSFDADKRGLVAANAALLRERFPDYDMAWASFVEADPLLPLRCAIERRVPPAGPVRILAGRDARLGSWLSSRAAALAVDGTRVIALEWGRDGATRLRAMDGGAPQSLGFDPGESAALDAYLAALDIRGIEVAEPDAVPGHVVDAVLKVRAPLSISVVGRSAARALTRDRPRWAEGAEIVAGDRMVAAALGTGPGTPARDAGGAGSTAPGRPVRVAALSPTATASADRLLVRLDRRLRAAGGRVVVFGRPWSAGRALPEATAAMAPDDYPTAVRHRRITHLLLADPDLPFGQLDDLRREVALPSAYVDWSGGRLAPAAGDLALAEDMPCDAAAEALAAWCGAGRPAPAASRHGGPAA